MQSGCDHLVRGQRSSLNAHVVSFAYSSQTASSIIVWIFLNNVWDVLYMMYKFHVGTIMGSGVIINSVNSVAHLCLPHCVGEVLSIPCMEFLPFLCYLSRTMLCGLYTVIVIQHNTLSK